MNRKSESQQSQFKQEFRQSEHAHDIEAVSEPYCILPTRDVENERAVVGISMGLRMHYAIQVSDISNIQSAQSVRFQQKSTVLRLTFPLRFGCIIQADCIEAQSIAKPYRDHIKDTSSGRRARLIGHKGTDGDTFGRILLGNFYII